MARTDCSLFPDAGNMPFSIGGFGAASTRELFKNEMKIASAAANFQLAKWGE
jgi:hypothetical protein